MLIGMISLCILDNGTAYLNGRDSPSIPLIIYILSLIIMLFFIIKRLYIVKFNDFFVEVKKFNKTIYKFSLENIEILYNKQKIISYYTLTGITIDEEEVFVTFERTKKSKKIIDQFYKKEIKIV
ncbi:MAG: hypothetical protein GX203_01690 [Acholeplasmataceae bacterium]|nr:hypothetical protein [Acholeplasmataceae bacterium]HPT89450.1 hypothetical protein [Bacilli bacterium]